jgi:ribosomal protein S18 acetylase RimI-like enzyme
LAGAVRSRFIGVPDREAALEYLSQDSVANLILLDLTARLGRPPEPGESTTEIVGAWCDEKIIGLAGLRPSVVLDAGSGEEVVEAFLPYLEGLSVGLVKSFAPVVDQLWSRLSKRGSRRAIIDRVETTYVLREVDAKLVDARPDERGRVATKRDLENLVIAARESLREESRPDPFSGDMRGFQRWVLGRVPRARVVEHGGRVAMVGYADVQRPEGWLLQGIYTWPGSRRRGIASFGLSELCREAFRAGADHVQLAVVDGNIAAQRLYERLGFCSFAKLRTILFT